MLIILFLHNGAPANLIYATPHTKRLYDALLWESIINVITSSVHYFLKEYKMISYVVLGYDSNHINHIEKNHLDT